MASRLLVRRLLASQARLGEGSLQPCAAVSWFSTAAKPAATDTAEVVRALECASFQSGSLKDLAENTSSMAYSDMLQLMQQQGFTPVAAEDVLGRLERSGALLNIAGTVLLRPGEVAEALALVLPGSPTDTQQRLASLQQELTQLEELQGQIKRQAFTRHHAMLWGGLLSQAAMWGILFRLTFYELSWDVMEPICFFVGGGQAMLCYTYFMATRREFSWEGALERHVGRWEAERLQRAGFDTQRYSRLKREVARLSELLAAQQQDAVAAAAAADSKKEE